MANAEDLETLEKAANLKAAGFRRDAVDLCQSLVRDNPEFFEAHAVKMEALQYAEDGSVEETFESQKFRPDLNSPGAAGLVEPTASSSLSDKFRVGYMALDFRASPARLGTHTARWLPAIAQHRPAPVQISWHNNCSVGIPEVDYFIGDPISTPSDGPEAFLERVIRKPCWTIQAFPYEIPDIDTLPVQADDYVTFGSFNNPIKITTRVNSLWSRVLQQVPNSRLLLKLYDIYTNTVLTERIAKGFTDHGIAADRIQFLDSTENRGQHLAQYKRIDIAIDRFPFSGATTTFEALLMGVPVISLLGDRFVARISSSLLHSVGLQAFSVTSEEAYISRATELAGNVDFLARIRGALWPMLQASRRFARNLERVYRAAWRMRQTKMAQLSQ